MTELGRHFMTVQLSIWTDGDPTKKFWQNFLHHVRNERELELGHAVPSLWFIDILRDEWNCNYTFGCLTFASPEDMTAFLLRFG